ncbi:MAG: DUF2165 domain-containing protein [Actinomycetota bacterium]
MAEVDGAPDRSKRGESTPAIGSVRWKDFDLRRAARLAASTFVLMTASYYLVVGLDNVSNPSSNWAYVVGVISGDGVPADSGFEWRFIDATWFHALVYAIIIAGELAAGGVLACSAVAGFRRTRSSADWADAQRGAILGCLIGLAVFFVGFIVIGGNWWVMYMNQNWNGLTAAFQNSVMTALTLIVVLVVAAGDGLANRSASEALN